MMSAFFKVTLGVISLVFLASAQLLDLAWEHAIFPYVNITSDNILQVDWSLENPTVQPRDLEAVVMYNQATPPEDKHYFLLMMNHTVLVGLSEGAAWDQKNVTFLKTGFSSNAYESESWGFNAAVNVANGSQVWLDSINVTTNNGAIGLFAYGNGTFLDVDFAQIYSSGPIAHSIFAAGGSEVFAHEVSAYTGGRRSSIFASSKSNLTTRVALGHTSAAGSACFFSLGGGRITAQDVKCTTEQAPTLIVDNTGFVADFPTGGAVGVTLEWVRAKAGKIAAIAVFQNDTLPPFSMPSFVEIKNSVLETTGMDMPAIWLGNTRTVISVYRTTIKNAGNTLVHTDASALNQDLEGFVEKETGAQAFIQVQFSHLKGDLVSSADSLIAWALVGNSTWEGTTRHDTPESHVSIYLSRDSTWTLTAPVTYIYLLENEDETMQNILGVGDIRYNSTASRFNTTWTLPGGGNVTGYY